jgi:predicted RNA-binding protein with PUA-like domain
MAHWLMKSEPDCYGIQHLEKEGTGMWEGCRNYTVRNFLRDAMKPGDKAFFYHSNADPTGIVGIMEIVGEGYPDPTQFDKKSEYYDARSSKDNPRWYTRDVKFVRRLKRAIPLSELKSTPGLEDMAVTKKGQMLSITPVTESEWNIVLALEKVKA